MQVVPIFCSERSGTEAQLGDCRENFARGSGIRRVKCEAGRTF